MGRPPEDWAAVLDRLLEGDRLACMKLSRLITGLLAHWRAYDFREEWDDIVQEVLAAVVSGAQRGSIRSREATFSYVKQVATTSSSIASSVTATARRTRRSSGRSPWRAS